MCRHAGRNCDIGGSRRRRRRRGRIQRRQVRFQLREQRRDGLDDLVCLVLQLLLLLLLLLFLFGIGLDIVNVESLVVETKSTSILSRLALRFRLRSTKCLEVGSNLLLISLFWAIWEHMISRSTVKTGALTLRSSFVRTCLSSQGRVTLRTTWV